MPKIVAHDQYRKELLERSFDVLAERGYANVSMRQLAEAVGVSTGTLYHYFASKQAIFEQLVEMMVQRDVATFSEAVGHLDSLEAQIFAFYRYTQLEASYWRKQLLLLIDYYRQLEPDQVRAEERLQHLFQRYEQLFVEVTGIEDRALYKVLSCFFDGLTVQNLYLADAVSLDEVMVVIARMVRGYLEQPPGTLP